MYKELEDAKDALERLYCNSDPIDPKEYSEDEMDRDYKVIRHLLYSCIGRGYEERFNS